MKQFCKTLVSLTADIRAAFAGHSIRDATFAAFRAVKYQSQSDGSHLLRHVVRFFVAARQIAAQMVTLFLDRSGHIDGVETIVSNIQCVHEQHKHAQYLTLVKIYSRLWSVIRSNVLLRFSRISRHKGAIYFKITFVTLLTTITTINHTERYYKF